MTSKPFLYLFLLFSCFVFNISLSLLQTFFLLWDSVISFVDTGIFHHNFLVCGGYFNCNFVIKFLSFELVRVNRQTPRTVKLVPLLEINFKQKTRSKKEFTNKKLIEENSKCTATEIRTYSTHARTQYWIWDTYTVWSHECCWLTNRIKLVYTIQMWCECIHLIHSRTQT